MKRRTSGRSHSAFYCGLARRAELIGLAAALLSIFLLLLAPRALAGSGEAQKGGQPAPLSKAFKGRLPISELSENEAILHALNRLAFGPRPGDVERIRRTGLEKWVESQLRPEAIDDSALQARLARFPTIAMSTSELYDKFPNPAIEAARLGLTPEQYREQQRQQMRQEFLERQRQSGEYTRPGGRQRLGQVPDREQQRMEMLEASNSPRRIIGELSAAKLTRAVYSERQLEEVMADFWFNHFNVFAQKGPVLWMLPEYERQAIRPNALGKFSDLLTATAKSPAMLFYLDNWQSADPKAAEKLQGELNRRRQGFLALFGMNPRAAQNQRGRLGQPGAGQMTPEQRQQLLQRNMPRGLNENYARELMELHTLGVDGGYSQQDVIEVAKCFTGWTITAPRRNPEFRYEDRIHSREAKTVLGQKIDAGGMRDGEEVLSLLSRHSNTAKFISAKLARRFVSDAPPAALVERMARSFSESQGDIGSVLRTMIYSPEFWARSAYRAKIKKPFELVASAARALAADFDAPYGLVMWSGRIGEPLYLCQPPTGYSDKAETWVNTGALLNRLNFSMELASGRMRGARVDLDSILGGAARPGAAAAAGMNSAGAEEVLQRAIQVFLAGQVSEQTRGTLEKQLTDPQVLRATLDDPVRGVDAGLIAGLVLGSPEFQRR
jgi:uncharacterized protein (DUF1800 family)